jgi:hypothetical protein
MFTDATTVRFWLKEREKFVHEYLEMCTTLNICGDKKTLDLWRSFFKNEIPAAIEAARELNLWLKDRDLSRHD